MNGPDGLAEVRADWQSAYPIPEERRGDETEGRDVRRREAFHLVLSMPAGTPEIALKRAVREFAAEEFSGYQYVMALHTPTTDPDPEPSPHPHVHLTIKARALSGVRLNPRKADLQRWREGFAARLRDQGLEASATRRQVRLQREPGRGQKVHQMIARGVKTQRGDPRVEPKLAVSRNKATRERVLSDLHAVADLLERSTEASDQELGSAVRAGLQLADADVMVERGSPLPLGNMLGKER
jgi:type IV secretory pathway VirD2 relaxase